MTIVQKIVREPALTLGVITSALSLAVLFGVPISAEQMAGTGVFVGAVFALTRYLTTPSRDVIVQKNANGEVIGGAGIVPPLKGELLEVQVAKTSDVLAAEYSELPHYE
jgi:hypothetical protein